MIKTLLFDLDGTLLPVDTDTFVHSYTKLLAAKFKDLIVPEKLVHGLMASTDCMIESCDPEKTNQDVFIEDFVNRMGMEWSALEPVFQSFYDHEFPKLSAYADVKSHLGEAVKKAFEKGYEVVIATKPVFPRQAVLNRLSWIGADQHDYKLITSYENMHFCKPHINYYKEILELIGRSPSECVMIGNDLEEDICAGEIGIKTILVTDYLINRSGGEVKADLIIPSGDLTGVIEKDFSPFQDALSRSKNA